MIYLDNAAASFPKPPEVIRAVTGVMEKVPGNPGRGVLHRGDEVVVSHAGHNAVMRPLMGYQDRGVIRVRVIAPGTDGLISTQAVEEAVTPKTTLCILCHASNVTGIIQPAGAIADACHRFGIPLLLDAAQTAGTEDLAAVGADLIAMPGHKGLPGPMGTGALYVSPGIDVRPFREGGTGSLSESLRQPEMLPDRLESGTVTHGKCALWQGYDASETDNKRITRGVRSAACGAARIPEGKPGEGRRKTARGSLLTSGGLTDGFVSVHQRYSVPISTGAYCL